MSCFEGNKSDADGPLVQERGVAAQATLCPRADPGGGPPPPPATGCAQPPLSPSFLISLFCLAFQVIAKEQMLTSTPASMLRPGVDDPAG